MLVFVCFIQAQRHVIPVDFLKAVCALPDTRIMFDITAQMETVHVHLGSKEWVRSVRFINN